MVGSTHLVHIILVHTPEVNAPVHIHLAYTQWILTHFIIFGAPNSSSSSCFSFNYLTGTPSRRRSRSDRPAGDDDDEAVLTMDVIDALRQSKGEQFADRCVYNRANSLVAVRRLRIITIIIECTDKVKISV